MSEFPLQLERYFYTEQQVSANPNYLESSSPHLDFLIDASVVRLTDQPGKYGLTASATINQETSFNSPYSFLISAFGIVNVNKESDIAAAEAQIEVSGAQLLIGAIREHLAEMTSRGPWGAIYLDFVPIALKIDQNLSE